jgi:hypothetical protein
MITKLAAKRIDIEKPQQTFKNRDSPQSLDVFARAVWAIDNQGHNFSNNQRVAI